MVPQGFPQPPEFLQISFLFPIMYPRDAELKPWYRIPPSAPCHALLRAGHRAMLWDLFILSYNCTLTKAQRASAVILDNFIDWHGILNCPLFSCYILLLLKIPLLYEVLLDDQTTCLKFADGAKQNYRFCSLSEINMFI